MYGIAKWRSIDESMSRQDKWVSRSAEAVGGFNFIGPLCIRGWIGPNFSVRARPASDRVVPEPDSHSNILSEPDPSPTESMSQLFILMTHLRTFFMNSLPLLNSGINR